MSTLLQGTKETNIVIDYDGNSSGNDFVANLLNQSSNSSAAAGQGVSTSSFTSSVTTATNSFVAAQNLNREEKVYNLMKICEPHIDRLYECEMSNGINSDLCNQFQMNLHNCMTGNLCPSEQELKDANCDQLHLRFGGIDQLNRCLQLNKRLNNCLDNSLNTIWSTPLSIQQQQQQQQQQATINNK
ncbi:hypothetical protein PPL_03753 [Heterostelium album PN500]|uniref:Uncharacterized protein n=1 Tax=Heterostelium pallidum (strain ATCC 26659 / Pp 5 / PN500) TaxID=670386 RepID=D3B6K5_HETP5|nr:hypothetical protein PPL_03753 [Heterostelium album PN500]EFA82975.1 hypothetical protein PPL_03753 [Heterostelium album PN500]|eukprot:XP_020435092.1 hypothetical protein PPL_03753 [Heterostelium album PN500]